MTRFSLNKIGAFEYQIYTKSHADIYSVKTHIDIWILPYQTDDKAMKVIRGQPSVIEGLLLE